MRINYEPEPLTFGQLTYGEPSAPRGPMIVGPQQFAEWRRAGMVITDADGKHWLRPAKRERKAVRKGKGKR